MSLYTHEFQREVLYMLANNTVFATNYGCLLSEDCFDLAPMRTLFNLISQHMLSYETELEKKDLMLLIDDYNTSKGWSNETLKIFRDEVSDIYKSKPNNETFVTDKVINFVRKQAMKRAIEDSITILERSEDTEGVLKLIDKAVSIGTGVQDTKTMEDLFDLVDLYKSIYDPGKLIRTGIAKLDEAFSGGLAPGELHIFTAPPGSGKSTLGCNIGAYNVAMGKKVFHATLEIKELAVLKHYALRFSGMTHSDFSKMSSDSWKKKMERYRKWKNNLYVAYWPEKTANARTIRAWISHHRSTYGINPDLIIVDYDDCLSPVGGDTESMYEDAGSVYIDLIQLADYFKCFTGDTEIMTDGMKVRLDQLKKNDVVTVNSFKHGSIIETKAISLGIVGYTDKLVNIHLTSGEPIRCTLDHKILIADFEHMVEAQYVKPGDNLLMIDHYANRYKSSNKVLSTSIEILKEPIPVYCLNVPVYGNFALGNGVIVSNCPVVSFSQLKRESWDKPEKDELLTFQDLAHSAKKAHKAYSVSSINFKKGYNKGLLYLDKNRRGESSVVVNIERDFSRSYIGGVDKGTLYEDGN